ncbi:hypothetical protein XENTR_v10014079 [Xenopus tropicalis]|nr:hypothetical protein XENTR_v10014079 [Xenopus tropicalis]
MEMEKTESCRRKIVGLWTKQQWLGFGCGPAAGGGLVSRGSSMVLILQWVSILLGLALKVNFILPNVILSNCVLCHPSDYQLSSQVIKCSNSTHGTNALLSFTTAHHSLIFCVQMAKEKQLSNSLKSNVMHNKD